MQPASESPYRPPTHQGQMSVPQIPRVKALNRARRTLMIVGVLTIIIHTVAFFAAEKLLTQQTAIQMRKNQSKVTLEQVRALPVAARTSFDQVWSRSLQKIRLINGAWALVGIGFVVCATMVYKKPIVATATGLGLYVGSFAVQYALAPEVFSGGLSSAILIKVLMTLGLIGALRAAITVEKQARELSTPIG
jgi:hypothetical protein